MLTLPYDFDTAATWQRIVRVAAAIAGTIGLCALGALASGKFAAAAGLALCFAIFALVARLARHLPMGAAGRITSTDVTVHAVRELGFSLPVPVGRYPLDRFQAIQVEQRVMVTRPPGSRTTDDLASVQLVGRAGVPTIEIMYARIGKAMAFADELSHVLQLECRRVAAPGTRIVDVRLGS